MSGRAEGGNDWAIVLAAGDGTRLRALTGGVPKQFCRVGQRSLLSIALQRASRVVPRERTLVIVADAHRRWWRDELAAHPAENVIVQPRNRGTAAGVLLPLATILERDAGAVVSLLPSDHHVRDEGAVADAIRAALDESAAHDEAVLLGIEPESPETGYGWIVPRSRSRETSAPVESFVEKPDLDGARDCQARGGFWNSLLMAARATALLELYRRTLPDLVVAFERLGTPISARPRALRRLYDRLPSTDLSRDVLQVSAERLRVRVVPACGWDDLGTPERVARSVGEISAPHSGAPPAADSRTTTAARKTSGGAVRYGGGPCCMAERGREEKEITMRVQECMTRPVFSCRPDTTMEQAARLMWEHDCGILPVVDTQDRVVGLVTDRDVCMGAYTRGATLRDSRVETAMSKRVRACLPTDSLEEAIRMLGDHRVRRVPVVDRDGKLVGILSTNDVFRHIVAMQDPRARTSLTARLVEAMASICEPNGMRSEELEPLPADRNPERAKAGAI